MQLMSCIEYFFLKLEKVKYDSPDYGKITKQFD